MAATVVTSRCLVEGAWYAAEQCGLLLADAERLYISERYSTAAGLALLAREELGKARILLAIRRLVNSGEAVTLDQVRDAIEDHPTKQTNAPSPLVFKADPGTSLAALADSLFRNAPGTKAFAEAHAKMQELAERVAKRGARERPHAREAALYVDPDESGSGWSHPIAFSRERADREIHDANNAYGTFLMNLRAGPRGGEVDAPMAAHLEQWSERPTLPNPSWPKVPPDQRRLST